MKRFPRMMAFATVWDSAVEFLSVLLIHPLSASVITGLNLHESLSGGGGDPPRD